jgi:hypothetical protein
MKTEKKTDRPWKRLYVFMTTFGLGLAMVVSTPGAFATIGLTYMNLVNLLGQIMIIGSFLGVLVTILQKGKNSEVNKLLEKEK